MKVDVLEDEDMYSLLNDRHNAPSIQDQKEQNDFQAERRAMYQKLVEPLAAFGEQGDLYGISDFAVRPDLRDRPTVLAPPASHVRQFTVTCLTETFYNSGFFEPLHEFLNAHAREYRVLIDQDFNPQWSLMIFLTYDLARVNCTDPAEASRLINVLTDL